MAAMNMCYMCGKEYTLCKNLYVHLRKVHKLQSNQLGRGNFIKCPKDDCRFSCNFMHELRFHVEVAHSVAMVKETCIFLSWDDFLQWKAKEEEATRSRFVKHGGTSCAKDGTEKIKMLCHRSGKFVSHSEGKRMLKSKGSNKLGSHCTASIEVCRNKDGTCVVVYFRTHFGHEQDIGFLHLSRADREAIAGKILAGMTFERILEEVRGSVQNGSSERLHLLTRQDLHNIKRDFGIDDISSSLQGGEPSELESELSSTTKQTETSVQEEASTILSPINKQDNEQIIAVQTRQLYAKIKVLASRVRSGKLSVETLSAIEKGVDNLLSLCNSDLSKEIPYCASSGKEKVHQISDNQNLCPKSIFSEPAVAANSNVAGALRQPDSTMLCVHTDFDHTYSKN